MNGQIQFRDLRSDLDRGQVEAVYQEIIKPSFQENELDTLETILDGLTPGGGYEAWGLCAMDGETPVGCIMGYPNPESRVLLIGYVAVRPGVRARGIGGLLLEEARRQWYEKRTDLTLVVAEIDDPRRHPRVGDIDPERRVAFYARHGVQIIVGPYFQPRLEGEGKERVYGMFLSVLHGGEGATVPTRQLTAFLREYFTASGEGSDWPGDEDKEGRWLLDWYRDRDTAALHPIGRYAEIELPAIPGRPGR